MKLNEFPNYQVYFDSRSGNFYFVEEMSSTDKGSKGLVSVYDSEFRLSEHFEVIFGKARTELCKKKGLRAKELYSISPKAFDEAIRKVWDCISEQFQNLMHEARLGI